MQRSVYYKNEPIDTDGKPINIERASSLFDNEPIRGEYSYPFVFQLDAINFDYKLKYLN